MRYKEFLECVSVARKTPNYFQIRYFFSSFPSVFLLKVLHIYPNGLKISINESFVNFADNKTDVPEKITPRSIYPKKISHPIGIG